MKFCNSKNYVYDKCFFAKELKIHDMNLKSSNHGLNNSFFKLDNHPGNVNY